MRTEGRHGGAGGRHHTPMSAGLIAAIVDEGLGNSSYLVDLGDRRALVVDPQRDPAPYLAAAAGSWPRRALRCSPPPRGAPRSRTGASMTGPRSTLAA